MRGYILLFIFLMIPIPSTLAEYRAYQLLIKNNENGKERMVLSTLDHLQYSSYYPVSQQEQVVYVKSWMCWGPSDHHQALCPAPENMETERFPANQ